MCSLTLPLILPLITQVDKLPRHQVATVGSWPEPLVVPEEVDELPVSEVPRGFICPITQVLDRSMIFPPCFLHLQVLVQRGRCLHNPVSLRVVHCLLPICILLTG